MTAASTDNLADLAAAGVSIWLDDLSRSRLTSGSLAALIRDQHVSGVTTNPSIFQAAITSGTDYDEQLASLAAAGADADAALFAITTDDVRAGCDVFASVAAATDGVDGRVSIEVDPRLAHQTGPTIEQAKALAAAVGRDNVYIKIPATLEGLPAIAAVLAEGISVNVTLIFGLQRYRAVMNAFVEGLERAHEAGHDLRTIHSVASFFVSRVDTEIDGRLEAIGTDAARALKGQAAVANARLAYQAFEEVFATPRWRSWPTRAPGGSGRCGRPPASRTPHIPTRSTSSTSSPPTASTPCRRRPCALSPITAPCVAIRSPGSMPPPKASSMRSRRRASPTSRSSKCSNAKASRSSRRRGSPPRRRHRRPRPCVTWQRGIHLG